MWTNTESHTKKAFLGGDGDRSGAFSETGPHRPGAGRRAREVHPPHRDRRLSPIRRLSVLFCSQQVPDPLRTLARFAAFLSNKDAYAKRVDKTSSQLPDLLADRRH